MIRATTPTHTFTLPFDYNTFVKKIVITYSQNGEIVLNKTEKDIVVNGNAISVKLTQEDTVKFVADSVKIQLRVLTLGEDVLVSQIFNETVRDVLNDEVL